MRRLIVFLLTIQTVSICALASTAQEAISAFKTGDYKTAIPILLQAASGPDHSSEVRAALLSALTYEGRVDDATNLALALETEAPNSPDAIAARGDFLFYMGDIAGAEKLYRAALKLNEQNARAYLGLYRIFRAASYYKTARTFCLRAHALDPEDALITLTFLRYTVGEVRQKSLGPFMETHPWFAKATFFQMQEENAAEIRQELEEQHAFALEGARHETTVPLSVLYSGATRARGVGIPVTIAGGKPIHLLLDTGASGILLTQQAVDRAGLKHLGSSEHWGIGDAGVRKGFYAVADSCSVGTLGFKRCVFRVEEGKHRIGGEEDGLVGADFFEDYLVHLDFQRHIMQLKPLEQRPPSPQGYDRVVPPDETDFTPVFRFGHQLCLPTMVNRKASGLFLLDTGAGISMMDSTFARLSTKIHHDEYMHVRGVSGSVKEVFEADKAELQFARFRQNNLGLTSVNLNNTDRHQDTRMSGILGLPVLAMFRLDIDYRNGLVKFDYALR